jgi:hypothetical protein
MSLRAERRSAAVHQRMLLATSPDGLLSVLCADLDDPVWQMPEPGLADDPATRSVADFLRNEKASGLRTKEAVQYEKVCSQ